MSGPLATPGSAWSPTHPGRNEFLRAQAVDNMVHPARSVTELGGFLCKMRFRRDRPAYRILPDAPQNSDVTFGRRLGRARRSYSSLVGVCRGALDGIDSV